MTQGNLFAELPTVRGGITWDRTLKVGVFPCYAMLDNGTPTGWHVRHCGHQTAICPFYISGPNGEHFQAYQNSTKAKARAIQLRQDAAEDRPLFAHAGADDPN